MLSSGPAERQQQFAALSKEHRHKFILQRAKEVVKREDSNAPVDGIAIALPRDRRNY